MGYLYVAFLAASWIPDILKGISFVKDLLLGSHSASSSSSNEKDDDEQKDESSIPQNKDELRRLLEKMIEREQSEFQQAPELITDDYAAVVQEQQEPQQPQWLTQYWRSILLIFVLFNVLIMVVIFALPLTANRTPSSPINSSSRTQIEIDRCSQQAEVRLRRAKRSKSERRKAKTTKTPQTTSKTKRKRRLKKLKT